MISTLIIPIAFSFRLRLCFERIWAKMSPVEIEELKLTLIHLNQNFNRLSERLDSRDKVWNTFESVKVYLTNKIKKVKFNMK